MTEKAYEQNVKITLSSDRETMAALGVYTENPDGFLLRFSIGDDKYTVVHSSAVTRFTACGEISYDIAVGDEPSETVLTTPYGDMRFKVVQRMRVYRKTETSCILSVVYALCADGEETDRNVGIKIDF